MKPSLVARRFCRAGRADAAAFDPGPVRRRANVNALVDADGRHAGQRLAPPADLTQAHILARRKEGLQVYYKIADPSIPRLCEVVCGAIEKQLAKQAGPGSSGPERAPIDLPHRFRGWRLRLQPTRTGKVDHFGADAETLRSP
jgi:DNA-binding transcriptional ArsR family regulator